MRGVLLVLLAGCTLSRHDDVDEPDMCGTDAACHNGEVCARNHGCYPPSQVRPVSVIWTIGGMVADPVTCAGSPELRISFGTGGDGEFDHVGFEPVPCRAGRYSIDKIPKTFTSVQLGGRQAPVEQHAQLDAATGEAALDLPL